MTIFRHRWAACALLLGGSGVWAASILTSPAAPREDASGMRALMRRLSGESAPVPAEPEVAASAGNPPAPSSPPPAAAPLEVKKLSAAAFPALVAHAKPPVLPAASGAPQIEAASDPIKNLALTGVTHANGEDEALVTDLSNRERAYGAVGGRVFGLEIKEIGEDRIRLSQGGVDYLLRLGEKAVPESVRIAGVQGGEDEGGFPGFGPGGGGPGGRGGRGGQGAFGGPGGFGNRGGFGGPGVFGGQGNFGGGSPTIIENGGGGGGFGGRGAQNASQGGNGGFNGAGQGGGFGGVGLGGGGFGGTGTGSTGNTSGSSTATANPQTARRTGSRLESGVQAQPSPETISNPQTQRRLGTTGGPAFGDGSGTNTDQNGGVSPNGIRGRTN